MSYQWTGEAFTFGDIYTIEAPLSITMVTGEGQHKMFDYYIPTYISACPHCKHENKWGTTGLVSPITCKNCQKSYKMF